MHQHPSSYPFKRPFKGKRAAFRALEDLDRELPQIELQLERLSVEWTDRASVEGLSLTLTRQGAPTLKWRVSKRIFGDQRYIDLFSEAGEPIITSASPEVLQLLIGYETHRVLLNARSRAAYSTHRALVGYRSAIERLPPYPESLVPHDTDDSLVSRKPQQSV